MAAAEALPEAERVLAAVQQVDAEAALHLTLLAAPAALVSIGWGQGGVWQLGEQCSPGGGRALAHF